MTHHFDTELNGLKLKLLAMASQAETAVNQAVQALTERDHALALQVKENDRVLDQFEVEIDDLAIHLLAKAPLASDLRLITVAMKICQNLERVGIVDKAYARADALSGGQQQRVGIARALMQEPVVMLADEPVASLDPATSHSVMKYLEEINKKDARALIPRDKEVNSLNKQIHRELAHLMIADPETITRCLNLMIVSKSLERIADHATNVAEEVVYLCEAQDIRHPTSISQPGGSGAVDEPGAKH